MKYFHFLVLAAFFLLPSAKSESLERIPTGMDYSFDKNCSETEVYDDYEYTSCRKYSKPGFIFEGKYLLIAVNRNKINFTRKLKVNEFKENFVYSAFAFNCENGNLYTKNVAVRRGRYGKKKYKEKEEWKVIKNRNMKSLKGFDFQKQCDS